MLMGIKNIYRGGDGKYKDYLNTSVLYNWQALLSEMQINNPSLTMEQLSSMELEGELLDVYNNQAFRPVLIGGLAEKLGLDKKVFSPKIWEDLFNGYIEEGVLPKNSILKKAARDTARGKMLKLSGENSLIDDSGNYTQGARETRASDELLCGLGKGLSLWLVSRQMQDKTTLNKVQTIFNDVIREEVLPILMEKARCRVSQGNEKEIHDVLDLLMVSFMHIETRNIQPHIHFHLQLMNTCLGDNGKLISLMNDLIYESKAEIDSRIQAGLKDKFEKEFNLRFKDVLVKADELNEFLDIEQKNIASFDVVDEIVDPKFVEHYSQRIKEIEEKLRLENKAITPETRAIAQKSTRDDKTEFSPSELLAIWEKEFDELGFKAQVQNPVDEVKSNVLELTDKEVCENYINKKFEQDNIAKLTSIELGTKQNQKKKKVSANTAFKSAKFEKDVLSSMENRVKEVNFRLSQFKGHVIKQALKHCDKETAYAEAERIADKYLVLHIPKEDYEYFKPYLNGEITDKKQLKQYEFMFEKKATFITREMIRQAEFIEKVGVSRSQEEGLIKKQDEHLITKVIIDYETRKGFKLSHDQLEDIKMTCTGKGAFLNTKGMAGAGKSTSKEVVVEVLEKAGYNIWGTSVSETATKGLSEAAGIHKSRCLNSAMMLKMLDEGKLQLDSKSVIVFDEAGMATLNTIYRLVDHAARVGAKINFVGEQQQLQPVGAGSTFKYLTENYVSASLTTINRQRDEAEKNSVRLMQSGNAKEALEYRYDKGDLLIEKSIKDCIVKVAEEYVASPLPSTDKIIMSGLNSDNEIINDLIKKKLIEKGEIDVDKYRELNCADGYTRRFNVGDRIAFFQNSKTLDKDKVAGNSETGRIINFVDTRNGNLKSVVIELDRQKEGGKKGEKEVIYIDATAQAKFRYGWAGTVHKSQGQSKEKAWGIFTQENIEANLAYVMASRHKDSFRLFISDEFKDKMEGKLKGLSIDERQKSKLEWLRDEKGVAVPERAFNSFVEANRYLDKYVDVQQPSNKSHKLDMFSSLIDSASKFNVKKNVSDFVAVEQGLEKLKKISKERKKELADLKLTMTLEEKAKFRVPVAAVSKVPVERLRRVAINHKKAISLVASENRRKRNIVKNKSTKNVFLETKQTEQVKSYAKRNSGGRRM